MNNEELAYLADLASVVADGVTICTHPRAVSAFFDNLSEERLAEICDGYATKDKESLYVAINVCLKTGRLPSKAMMSDIADNVKKHCKSEFYKDEYIDTIKLPNVKNGDLTLVYATYAKDEIFQYDMPLVDPPALRLGYFDEDVSFPAIYEGNMPWVSACPSEINSMSGSLSEVSGKVLVLGLGLGYYPFIASQKSNVREITIVEINSEIIDIFTRYVLPQFPMKQKIKIVCSDAIKYMASVKKGEYDYCFADIWEGAEDGADRYIAIKKYEAQLHGTKFSYWIEDEIKRYLGDEI